MKTFKTILLTILVIGIIAFCALSFFSQQNNTSLTPETIDLTVDCSNVSDLLVTASVDVNVTNLSSRNHNDVSVKITAFDESGNNIKEKYTTFERTLPANGNLSKPVLLPASTSRCECELVSSNPE